MTRSLVALVITLSSAHPAIAQVPAGPEFLVNTGTSGWQEWPTLAITHDGFVVTWSSNQNAPPESCA